MCLQSAPGARLGGLLGSLLDCQNVSGSVGSEVADGASIAQDEDLQEDAALCEGTGEGLEEGALQESRG